MAKVISITFTDDEFAKVKKAYSTRTDGSNTPFIEEDLVTEEWVKARLIKLVSSRVLKYEEYIAREAAEAVSFNPS